MERLTYIDNEGWYVNGENGERLRGRHIDRLAGYEDTDLAPEQIEKAMEDCANTVAENQFAIKDVSELGGMAHLRELVEAEKDGRLVMLPCKVGDQLWYYPKWYAESGFTPEPLDVEEVNSHSGFISVMCYLDPDTKIEATVGDFGKIVFLTREEAESALKEQQNENT